MVVENSVARVKTLVIGKKLAHGDPLTPERKGNTIFHEWSWEEDLLVSLDLKDLQKTETDGFNPSLSWGMQTTDLQLKRE